MKNSRAYYKLTTERHRLENLVETYDDMIKNLTEEAKKLKKGSLERQDLMRKANNIRNDGVYKDLKLQIKTMNFCINTVFYN